MRKTAENLPRPIAGMEAPVLSLKEVGADMINELKMGRNVKVGVRDSFKYPPTLGQ